MILGAAKRGGVIWNGKGVAQSPHRGLRNIPEKLGRGREGGFSKGLRGIDFKRTRY